MSVTTERPKFDLCNIARSSQQ